MFTKTSTRTTAQITAAAPQAESASVPAVSRRRLIARMLMLLPALAVVLASVGVTAPAQAAGTSSTGLTFCTNTAYAPVTLKIWTGSAWSNYKTGKTAANGCGTFRYLDAGRAYYVAVNFSTGRCYNPFMQVTQGNSTYSWVYANQIANVGYFGTSTYVPC